MKKTLFALALLFAMGASAQSLPDFKSYPVETAEQATASTDIAKKTSDYLLNNPIDKYVLDRTHAASFLIKWMGASPDYSFAFDNTFTIFKNDTDQSGLYLAALSKYQIEHKQKEITPEGTIAVWETIAKYIDNPANNVKAKGKVKKLVEACKAVKLQEFLDKQKG